MKLLQLLHYLFWVLLLLAGLKPAESFADPAPLQATTATGDRILLYPNGRWEYVDAKKAEAQRPAVEAYEKERSLEQGGLLGIGRKVKPGDPDYNRGSMGGKSR